MYEKESVGSDETDERIRVHKLTLGTMPSAMPTSMIYYQEKSRGNGHGWEDLESQTSLGMPRPVHNAPGTAM